MRIGIIGAGAIGCVVGGMLTKAGRDLTLIDQWPEHVDTIKRQGLRLSGTCGDHVIRVKALHVHELQSVTQPFDAVFVSVKSYDTEWATALALPYLARPDGVVVDFQNGINDERVAAVATASARWAASSRSAPASTRRGTRCARTARPWASRSASWTAARPTARDGWPRS